CRCSRLNPTDGEEAPRSETTHRMTLAPNRTATTLDGAVERATERLLELQHPDGWWVGELESNATMIAQHLIWHHFLGLRTPELDRKIANELLARQRDNGTWAIWFEGPPDLSTTIEAYTALKLAGVDRCDRCGPRRSTCARSELARARRSRRRGRARSAASPSRRPSAGCATARRPTARGVGFSHPGCGRSSCWPRSGTASRTRRCGLRSTAGRGSRSTRATVCGRRRVSPPSGIRRSPSSPCSTQVSRPYIPPCAAPVTGWWPRR